MGRVNRGSASNSGLLAAMDDVAGESSSSRKKRGGISPQVPSHHEPSSGGVAALAVTSDDHVVPSPDRLRDLPAGPVTRCPVSTCGGDQWHLCRHHIQPMAGSAVRTLQDFSYGEFLVVLSFLEPADYLAFMGVSTRLHHVLLLADDIIWRRACMELWRTKQGFSALVKDIESEYHDAVKDELEVVALQQRLLAAEWHEEDSLATATATCGGTVAASFLHKRLPAPLITRSPAQQRLPRPPDSQAIHEVPQSSSGDDAADLPNQTNQADLHIPMVPPVDGAMVGRLLSSSMFSNLSMCSLVNTRHPGGSANLMKQQGDPAVPHAMGSIDSECDSVEAARAMSGRHGRLSHSGNGCNTARSGRSIAPTPTYQAIQSFTSVSGFLISPSHNGLTTWATVTNETGSDRRSTLSSASISPRLAVEAGQLIPSGRSRGAARTSSRCAPVSHARPTPTASEAAVRKVYWWELTPEEQQCHLRKMKRDAERLVRSQRSGDLHTAKLTNGAAGGSSAKGLKAGEVPFDRRRRNRRHRSQNKKRERRRQRHNRLESVPHISHGMPQAAEESPSAAEVMRWDRDLETEREASRSQYLTPYGTIGRINGSGGTSVGTTESLSSLHLPKAQFHCVANGGSGERCMSTVPSNSSDFSDDGSLSDADEVVGNLGDDDFTTLHARGCDEQLPTCSSADLAGSMAPPRKAARSAKKGLSARWYKNRYLEFEEAMMISRSKSMLLLRALQRSQVHAAGAGGRLQHRILDGLLSPSTAPRVSTSDFGGDVEPPPTVHPAGNPFGPSGCEDTSSNARPHSQRAKHAPQPPPQKSERTQRRDRSHRNDGDHTFQTRGASINCGQSAQATVVRPVSSAVHIAGGESAADASGEASSGSDGGDSSDGSRSTQQWAVASYGSAFPAAAAAALSWPLEAIISRAGEAIEFVDSDGDSRECLSSADTQAEDELEEEDRDTPISWKFAYYMSQRDAKRRHLSVSELRQCKWKISFRSLGGSEPMDAWFGADQTLRVSTTGSTKELSSDRSGNSRAHGLPRLSSTYSEMPPFAFHLLQAGAALHVHKFPQLMVQRRVSTEKHAGGIAASGGELSMASQEEPASAEAAGSAFDDWGWSIQNYFVSIVSENIPLPLYLHQLRRSCAPRPP